MKTLKALFFFLVVMTANSYGQVYWIGGTPGSEHDWNISDNWHSHRVPDDSDKVIIPKLSSNHAFYPIINAKVQDIAHLEIQEGAMLNLMAGASITINDKIFDREGTLLKALILKEEIINIGEAETKGSLTFNKG